MIISIFGTQFNQFRHNDSDSDNKLQLQKSVKRGFNHDIKRILALDRLDGQSLGQAVLLDGTVEKKYFGIMFNLV